MVDTAPRFLQENLLTLLCFDSDKAQLIRNTVDLSLFEGTYKEIASRVYDYLDQFKVSPGPHVADLFEDILDGDDTTKRKYYEKFLVSLHESQDHINTEYVISRLSKFVRQQRLKIAIIESAEILQAAGEDAAERAEEILNKSLRNRLELFDSGSFLGDFNRSFNFLDREADSFLTGIPELDKKSLGPARKEMLLFVAGPKAGKTWWLINLGKQAMLQRLRVCHITLEVSEEIISQRYFQAFFAIPKRQAQSSFFSFETDALNRVIDFIPEHYSSKLSFDQPDIREKFLAKANKWKAHMNNIVVKQFPDGQLTIRELQAYLDNLEMRDNFVPDLLILDYADKMKINAANFRIDLGITYKDLRGIAVERNFALATASQSNREGASKHRISEGDIAEDFSKIAIADNVITYSRSEEEKALNLARIYVAAARNEEDKFSLFISQDYSIGQFCLDSGRMVSKYDELLKEFSE